MPSRGSYIIPRRPTYSRPRPSSPDVPRLGPPPAPQRKGVPLPGGGAVSSGPMPWDSIYQSRLGQVSTSLQGTEAALAGDEDRLSLESGVEIGRNPDGTIDVRGIRGDVTTANPFSRAALLQRAWEQGQQGNTTSYAARGQLYSGALQNAQNATRREFDEGQNALLRGFSNTLTDIQRRRQEARAAAAAAQGDAEQERILTALANRPDPAADDAVSGPLQSGLSLSREERARRAREAMRRRRRR